MTTSPGELVWTQFWQVTAVAVAVGLVTVTCCRKRPHLAYMLWMVVLVKSLVPPFWSSPTSLFSWATQDVSAGASKIDVPIAADAIPYPLSQRPLELNQDLLVGVDVPPSNARPNPESELANPPLESPMMSGTRMMMARSSTVLELIWLSGALIYASCVLLFTIRFWRTLQTNRVPVNEGLTNLLFELSKRLGIRRVVRLWVTSEPIGPLTFGWFWPTVVMPESLVAHRSLAELEPLLAHELVHIRRGDAFIGLAQVVSQSLWWFHPLIWLANRRIVFERERCCDEEVVAGLAMEPARYARGLLSVLELKQQWCRPAISPGASSFEINQQRLAHIMSSENGFRRKTPRVYWLAVIVLALLLVPGASLTGLSGGLDDPQDNSQEASNVQANPANPKPVEDADDKAKLAGAEMHIVGIYGPKDSGTKRVDIKVLPMDKPVVLVLTSYYSVNWHVTLADGARIEKTIVGGYSPQEIDGLPAEVPLVNRSYFPGDGSRRNDGWFYAWKWNTFEYRRMVETLNGMTGLLVSTFQSTNEGDSFVVDGRKGRKFAQQASKPKTARVKEPTAHELLAASADAEMHVVGLYMPNDGDNGDCIDVEVRSTTKPVVLVVSSYMNVLWNVKLAPGAQLKAVIIGGYYEQEIDGVPDDIPVLNLSRSRDRTSRSRESTFCAWEWNTFDYRQMLETLNEMTGLLVSTFQASYEGRSVVVDGTRGRKFAQKERKPPVAVPNPPTPQELLAAAADAELHIVSVSRTPRSGNGDVIEVDVQATNKPVVLVLACTRSALWKVKPAAGVQIKAVIVGWEREQDVEGVSAETPIMYGIKSSLATDSNTFEYRRMVETLNEMTGLLVCTFQGKSEGSSFVIDGKRGRKFAQTELKPRPTVPKELAPQELLAVSAGAELHVVSIYRATGGKSGDFVEVVVPPISKPIVLVLAAYSSVIWKLKVDPQAQVKAVIVAGYFEQELEGAPADISLIYRSYFPNHNRDFFYAYKSDTPECDQMVEKLKQMTGLSMTTLQMKEEGAAFVVDGKRGHDSARNGQGRENTKGVESSSKAPEPREDPAADVADIPSQERQAGGDANKRYMLIGPSNQAEPPEDGFKLIVILPGGDGSADFHPFVKRIFKCALSDEYLVAQPIAIKWTPDQQIVWPTKTLPVEKMKFGTEEFIEAVIEDVTKKHKLDRKKVFSLSWSSSGPAAYATSLQKTTSVTGSFIAMSVFRPEILPPLDQAKGHAYYLYHSPLDRVCPYRMAEEAAKSLAKNGATVHLETYEGGHGWASGNVYEDIRAGIEWLEEPE